MAAINNTLLERLTPAMAERFWSRVDKGPDCWLWTGPVHKVNGYGMWTVRFEDGTTGSLRPHRAAWRFARGPIPDGLTIDHLCRTKLCVNPSHLEPVPPAVNTARVPKKPRHQRSASVRERTGPRAGTTYAVLFRQGDKQRSVTFATRAEADAVAAAIHEHGAEYVLTRVA